MLHINWRLDCRSKSHLWLIIACLLFQSSCKPRLGEGVSSLSDQGRPEVYIGNTAKVDPITFYQLALYIRGVFKKPSSKEELENAIELATIVPGDHVAFFKFVSPSNLIYSDSDLIEQQLASAKAYYEARYAPDIGPSNYQLLLRDYEVLRRKYFSPKDEPISESRAMMLAAQGILSTYQQVGGELSQIYASPNVGRIAQRDFSRRVFGFTEFYEEPVRPQKQDALLRETVALIQQYDRFRSKDDAEMFGKWLDAFGFKVRISGIGPSDPWYEYQSGKGWRADSAYLSKFYLGDELILTYQRSDPAHVPDQLHYVIRNFAKALKLRVAIKNNPADWAALHGLSLISQSDYGLYKNGEPIAFMYDRDYTELKWLRTGDKLVSQLSDRISLDRNLVVDAIGAETPLCGLTCQGFGLTTVAKTC